MTCDIQLRKHFLHFSQKHATQRSAIRLQSTYSLDLEFMLPKYAKGNFPRPFHNLTPYCNKKLFFAKFQKYAALEIEQKQTQAREEEVFDAGGEQL